MSSVARSIAVAGAALITAPLQDARLRLGAVLPRVPPSLRARQKQGIQQIAATRGRSHSRREVPALGSVPTRKLPGCCTRDRRLEHELPRAPHLSSA